MPSRAHPAFSLLELLIVIAILSLLMGMVMPLYALARNASQRSATAYVLKKAEIAVRLFRTDFGAYPYQAAYPDDAAGETWRDRPNNLAYRLGTSGDPAAAARTDMANAVARFNYSCGSGGEVVAAPGLGYDQAIAGSTGAATLLNRMARERMRLAVLAGSVTMRGPLICKADGTVASDRTGTRVLATPAQSTAAAAPGQAPRLGWTGDYLGGELERRYIAGDAIIDAWGNPLVYISQVLPGIRGATNLDSCRFGLGASGFDPTTGPGPGIRAGTRPLLLGFGRIRLSRTDAGDGAPTPGDATWFPDPARLAHSDSRWYAAVGCENEFELWSAGRDGSFAYLRDDAANRDNLAAASYDRGLE